MLRFAQHDNLGVSTCHAERSKAESKHLNRHAEQVHWITVVYLGISDKKVHVLGGDFFLGVFSSHVGAALAA